MAANKDNITKRLVLGSPLTLAQGDANFTELENIIDDHTQFVATQEQTNTDVQNQLDNMGSVAEHEAKPDPHPQYLTSTEGDNYYDAAGTASSAISSHENASDPHPQYATDADISSGISTHESEANPHPQYALESSLSKAATRDIGSDDNNLPTNIIVKDNYITPLQDVVATKVTENETANINNTFYGSSEIAFSSVMLDVSRNESFVINNKSGEVSVTLAGTSSTKGTKIFLFIDGQSGIQWENRISWANGKPSLDTAWTIVTLYYIPSRGWFGTYELGGDSMPAAGSGGTGIQFIDPYISEESLLNSGGWDNVDGVSTFTFNQPDMQGGNKATTVTVTGANNHHLSYEMSDENAFVEGDPYIISANVKPGATWTDPFQLAYYSDGNRVNGTEFPVNSNEEFETLSFRFFAGPTTIDPEIRLLGYSNGNDGDSIRIGLVNVEKIDISGGLTSMVYEYPSAANSWEAPDDTGTTEVEGVLDESGTHNGYEVTMHGTSGHHIEYRIDLERNQAYRLRVNAKMEYYGADDFQIAYYNQDGEMVGIDVSPDSSFNEYEWKFFVPDVSITPGEGKIRLNGYSNGDDGAVVTLGYVTLERYG